MSTELKLNLAELEINENMAARNYWRKRLKDLQLQHYFPEGKGYAGHSQQYASNTFTIAGTLVKELNAMAPSDVSKHILLLACLSILLQRYSSSPDIVVFTPAYADDPQSSQKEAVFPVRISDFRDSSFRRLITALKYNLVQDLSHSNFPLEKMLNTDRKQLVELPVVGMLVNRIQKASAFDGLSPDMLFSFTIQDNISLTIRSDEQKYTPAYIEGIAAHYSALLLNLIKNKDLFVEQVEMEFDYDKLRIVNAMQDYGEKLVTERRPVPASYHQERLWFIDRFETGYLYTAGPVYHNIPLILDFEGALDETLLEKAVFRLLERHDVLRTCIVNTGGALQQRVRPLEALDFAIPSIQVTGEEADGQFVREIDTAFLPDELLIRALLLKMPEQHSRLILTIHHSIADRYSTILLARELVSSYRHFFQGLLLSVDRPPVQYEGFSLWQKEKLCRMEMNMLAYWKLRLKGKIKELNLPSDHVRAAVHVYTRGSRDILLTEELFRKLLTYSEDVQKGIDVILMTAFKILLYKYTQQEEIVIGTPVNNRVHESLRATIGPIDNLVVIRGHLHDELCFHDCVETTARLYREAIQYGMMPFDKLVSELAPEKDMSRTALFDVLFAYSDEIYEPAPIGEMKVRMTDVNLGYGKYDLNLFLQKNGDTVTGKLVYNSRYYGAAAIAAMAAHFNGLLQALVSMPGDKLATIDMLNGAERESVLLEYDNTDVAFPGDRTIVDIFKGQVMRTPDRIAVKQDDQQLTYRELDKLSDQLSCLLQRNGMQPGAIVGLLMDRSPLTVAGILAILKAGGAYLPIDSEYPEDRIAYFIRDSGAKFILTVSAFRHKAGNGCTVLCADVPAEEHDEREVAYPSVAPSDLCYIIYTSGTTGNPKGVMIEHRNVVRLFFNDHFQFDFGPEDVWTQFHSHCFDFSVWEIFGALLFGGKLVIIPKMVARDTRAYLDILRQEGVTVLNQTPSSFYNLAREELKTDDAPLKLRYVIFGGEALSPGKLKQWRRKYPDVKLINMFGITETTVHVTYKEIGEHEILHNISNIGKPIPTLSVYLLNANRQPVPKGAIGELYVGGAGVARGYLGNEALTASRFIDHPYKTGEKLYRSGDLARRLPSGDLEFLGRADHQVQLRGFRVEMGEIESHLLQHGKIKDTVVVAHEKDGDKFLAAYYVADEVIRSPELRKFLLDRLPDYMVPSYFVYLEKMPLTQNGKLDRDVLPKPEVDQGDEYVAPADAEEKKMTEIWAEVLGIDKALISVNSNFFDLGGHSLLAPALVSIISERLNINMHLKTLYQYPTITELTAYLKPNSITLKS